MPDNPNDPNQWLANMFAAGQEWMKPFLASGGDAKAEDAPKPAASEPANPYAQLLAASFGFAEMQKNYMRQVAEMWMGVTKSAAPLPSVDPGAAVDDKRFAADAWRSDPRFDMLARAYLGYSQLMQQSVEAAPVDDKTKAQLRFATRQFVDAMSPANYLATNPEAIELALQTGGASLTEGMALFFKDLAKGHISITDEEAFEVGKNVAVTEGSVVYRNELIELIQYAPRTPEVGERPLVIVPPCINKYYILDLTPENSFVRYAIDEGTTVFMVSWRNVSAAQGQLTWDDYLQMGVMRAIDVAMEITGADQVNALGFCIGGTLLAPAMAVMKANGEDKVASLTLLTSMLDFSDAGEIGALVTPESVAAREAQIGRGGVMEGKDLALTFSTLRANDLIWPYVVNSYLKGKRPPAFDLLYWNSDGTNLPGPMFCWYVRNTYLDNLLRVPGKTIECGVPVDLRTIDVPAFIYASRDDHIVPWKTAFLSHGILGGDNTFVLGASGHIAGVINPPAKGKRNYWSDGDASGDAEHWLATATSVPGSWWPVWGEWLAEFSGDPVPAPTEAGNAEYPPLAAAPGSYVLAKA